MRVLARAPLDSDTGAGMSMADQTAPDSLAVQGWPANRAEKEPVAPKAVPEERPGSKVFLWGKRLLPRGLPCLATIPCRLPNYQKAGPYGWSCAVVWVLFGGVATDEATRVG